MFFSNFASPPPPLPKAQRSLPLYLTRFLRFDLSPYSFSLSLSFFLLFLSLRLFSDRRIHFPRFEMLAFQNAKRRVANSGTGRSPFEQKRMSLRFSPSSFLFLPPVYRFRIAFDGGDELGRGWEHIILISVGFRAIKHASYRTCPLRKLALHGADKGTTARYGSPRVPFHSEKKLLSARIPSSFFSLFPFLPFFLSFFLRLLLTRNGRVIDQSS